MFNAFLGPKWTNYAKYEWATILRLFYSHLVTPLALIIYKHDDNCCCPRRSETGPWWMWWCCWTVSPTWWWVSASSPHTPSGSSARPGSASPSTFTGPSHTSSTGDSIPPSQCHQSFIPKIHPSCGCHFPDADGLSCGLLPQTRWKGHPRPTFEV